MKWAAALALLSIMLAILLAGRAAQAAELPLPWVQLADDGTLSVRAVVAPNGTCPVVLADGKAVAARSRALADDKFPVRVCEARVPAATAALTVGGGAMPVLPAAVQRLVVIGDTGCRIAGRVAQDCNDPAAWPFRTIAARAAARRPDLVIHVGDYYYREKECPAGHAGCAGSPYGDNWPVWRAEFFDPGAALLAAAPWVMVRGNHESCRRGGQGWVRLLEPHAGPLACAERTEPYRLAIGALSLLVFDSADADDLKLEADKVKVAGEQFARLLDQAPPSSWLVTHRPVWALAQAQLAGVGMNQTLQAAIRGQVPAGLDMVLAGHLHDFMSYEFGPERPSQLVVGTGGDNLLELADMPAVGTEIDGMPVTRAFALQRFGYLVLDRMPQGWGGAFYAPDDTILARCRLTGRELDCR